MFGRRFPFPFPDLVAALASSAEIVLPILLAFGLLTRYAALGLLCMTAVIQLIYPDGWQNFHLPWAAMALAIMAFGPGAISLDRLLGLDGFRRAAPVRSATKRAVWHDGPATEFQPLALLTGRTRHGFKRRSDARRRSRNQEWETDAMSQWPLYGRIEGAIVMIGFGSIGKGTLPLIERHFDFDKEHFVVIDPNDADRRLLDERGVKFVQLGLTHDNYRERARRSI